MKVLIACEESQTVCKAFREKGHEAYSCDIQEPSGGHPEWHIMGDAIKAIQGGDYRNYGRRCTRDWTVGHAYSASAVHLPVERLHQTFFAPVYGCRESGRTMERQGLWRGVFHALRLGSYTKNLHRESGRIHEYRIPKAGSDH